MGKEVQAFFLERGGGECAQSFSGECEYPRVIRAKRAAVVDVVVAVVEMLP